MTDRTATFRITVDTSQAEKAIARVLTRLWRQVPDPNPMPFFRLFGRARPVVRLTIRSGEPS